MFVIPGNLTILAFHMVHNSPRKGDDPFGCAQTQRYWAVPWLEAFDFALKRLNADSGILADLSIGLRLYDTCANEKRAVSQTMAALQPSNEPTVMVGAIGDLRSKLTVIESRILEQKRLMLLSSSSTSQELSDKMRFPYFFRLVPSDNDQARVMLDVLDYFGWNYVSLLYNDDSYGIYAMKTLITLTKQRSITIAYNGMVNTQLESDQAKSIARKLIKESRARVVITFVISRNLLKVFQAVETLLTDRSSADDRFIWLNSGQSFNDPSPYPNPSFLYGSIIIRVDRKMEYEKDFYAYFRNMTYKDLSNPWRDRYVADTFDCSWTNETNRTCQQFTDSALGIASGYKRVPFPIYAMSNDLLMTYALVVNQTITRKCPKTWMELNALRECLKGDNMLEQMGPLSFKGLTGRIRFDDEGNGIGRYLIKQWQPGKLLKVIGNWDGFDGKLAVDKQLLVWGDGNASQLMPVSTCSRECSLDEYKVIPDGQTSCWTCTQCSHNMYIVANRTGCSPCQPFRWPSTAGNYTHCEEIEVTFLYFWHKIAIVVEFLDLVTFISLCFVGFIYFRFRRHRLMKASSLELSFLTMTGILMSLVTAVFFLLRPSRLVCYVWRFTYNISYTMIYGPTLTKLVRIHRIFTNSQHGIKKMKYISSQTQFAINSVLIGVQLLISTVTAIYLPPTPKRYMPVETRPYVELLCDLPVKALVIPLSYNLVLIFVSAIYGYLTRMLPENFNESRYIFLSVCATLFLWIAFLPTYFSASTAIHKSMLLALSLILNSVVIILCIFISRVYALLVLDSTDLTYFTAGSTMNSRGKARSTVWPKMDENRHEISTISVRNADMI
ncbi:metabotropic glutamate receptor 3-like [Tubulanus polymorphus]|uniref:metabotropic glutamate receptor 3-like n=1 Tax=Tubulanus polymorphus TaxID=672921 RepID=UPI003DA27158